jgi:P4 family phage/plasmid primase-like protien
MYDTSLIKQRISCVDIAQRYGLPIRQSGDRCVSPLRSGASNPSSFAVDTDFWYDFGSGSGGDQIDLQAELYHSGDRGQAIRELARITGVSNDNADNTYEWRAYTEQMNAMAAYYHTQLTDSDRSYLRSRGITDDDAERLLIGRVTDGSLRGRLFLPYFSGSPESGGYVSYYATRALPGGTFPDNKYMKQKRDDFCKHIPWGMQTLNRTSDTLIIAEGYFDAASFECSGYPVLSAITGRFSRDQIPTVLAAARKFSRVFIVYDNDNVTHAGDSFAYTMSGILTRNRIPFIVGTVPMPYHDISEYYAAGGDLSRIISSAEDGVTYLATRITDFAALESFVYAVARHTKRTALDNLFSRLRELRRWDADALKSLHKSATTAPPENIVADEILRAYQLVYIPSVGFYEYRTGVWTRKSDDSIGSYVDAALGEFSTNQRVNAIVGLVRKRALREDIVFNNTPVWNFINGTLDLETGVFRDHNPNDYCSVQSSYPYNPDASYSAWAKFIDDITASDPRTAELLQLIPGYVFMPTNKYEKIFVLSGNGSNGKSKYLEILRQLFGSANVSHLQPRALLDKFRLIQFRESIVNMAGEIRSDLRDVEELMKSIASGEPQTACYKSKDFVTFVPRTKLIFATNDQLSSGDTSEGLTRRLIMVDFKVSFVDSPDPNDPYQRKKNVDILDDLTVELNSGGVFNWAYEGYKLLRAVGYFTETNDQTQLLMEFKRSSNPVLMFWEESNHRPAEYDYPQAYFDYSQWCIQNGHKPFTSQKFHAEYRKVSSKEYEPSVKSVRIDGKPRKQRFYRLLTTV